MSMNKHCCPDILENMYNVYSTTVLQYMYLTLALIASLKSVISKPVDWMTYKSVHGHERYRLNAEKCGQNLLLP